MHVSTSAWNLKCLLRFHQWVDLKKTPSPQLARLPFRVRFRPYAIRSSMRYKNPPRFWRFNGCGDGSVFHPRKPYWIAVGYVGYVFYALRICIAFRVPLYCGGWQLRFFFCLIFWGTCFWTKWRDVLPFFVHHFVTFSCCIFIFNRPPFT